MKEPKISELENLIEHFKKTEREHELEEVLVSHGIKSKKLEAINPETHEINPEALVIEKIATEEGLISKTKKTFIYIKTNLQEKWYLRYTIYYVLLFGLIFSVMNAPTIYNRLTYKPKVKEGEWVSYQTLIEPNNEKSAKIDPGEVVPQTPTLVIPKIGVRADIVFSETNNEAKMQQYLQKGVVKYFNTANPGEPGNTFIAGHSSNAWWVKGKYNFIFTYLDKLKIGDRATIYYQGRKIVYEVESSKVVTPKDVSVLNQGDMPELTLMTCTPLGTNWKRLIVKFKQVAPTYSKPQLVTNQYYIPPSSLISGDQGTMGGMVLGAWQWIKSLFGVRPN